LKLSVLKRAQDYLEGIKKNPLSFLEDAEIEEGAAGAITITIKVPEATAEAQTKDKPRQRQKRVKGDKNILATFHIETPQSGPQILTMGGETVMAITGIREGVLGLLAKCGIDPGLISAFPESEGKKQIVGILKE